VHLVASRVLLAAGRRRQAMSELGAALRSSAEPGDIASRLAWLSPSSEDVGAVLRPAIEAQRPRDVFTFVRALGLTHGLPRPAFEAGLDSWDESERVQGPELFAALCAVGLAAEAFPDVERLSSQRRLTHPDEAGGWWCGSEALRRPGRNADALVLLDEAVARLPTDVGLVLARARALLDAGRPRDAESAARASAEPDDPSLAEQRARVLHDALVADGRAHRALAEARSISIKDTRALWRVDLLVRALADAEAWEEAERVWRSALPLAGAGDAARLAALRRRLDARPRATSNVKPE
jgi:predicted Zn-dependent protease